jgi:LuxR family maltose regulon positive regulatory protein
MFHAGEAEACTITWARWLIHADRHSEARLLLGAEIRRAAAMRRRRRELKLRLMMALAYQKAGKQNLAGRSLLEALEIGVAGGFVRSILDERAGVVTLLKQLREHQADAPAKEDSIPAYIDRLLAEAGEQGRGAASGSPADSAAIVATLTDRERNLLRFVSAGLSNRDLADRLSVSTNTVKWHLRNIFEKLQIKNRVQAIALARRFGLID